MQRSFAPAWVAVALAAPLACGQEAMYTQAATMPSKGVSVIRPELHFWRFGTDPGGSLQTERVESTVSWQYGIARGASITLEVPVVWEDRLISEGEFERDHGVEDLDLMLKYRLYKYDSGGVDTLRVAALAGATFASGDDSDFSSQTVNPHVGIVLTTVRGRHGFNQELSFRLNTSGEGVDNTSGGEGPDEAIFYNSAYLYRIAPARYQPDTKGAWYITAEMNGLYETNGDNELRFSPGLMFEGWRFAFELMAQLPLYDDLEERAELDLGVGIGFRFTF